MEGVKFKEVFNLSGDFAEKSSDIVKSCCAMSHGGCSTLIHVEEGEVKKIEGWEGNPLTKGTMCPKGLSAKQLLYHPDRIKYPMKRVGERGEGEWERISWDEALDIAASEINRVKDNYGIEQVAFGSGTGRMMWNYLKRCGYAFGTPNARIGYPHNCFSPRLGVGSTMFGKPLQYDVENSNMILAFAINPCYSHPDQNFGVRFFSALKDGAKLAVVDPAKSPFASKADYFLQVRPATDAALILGMLNVILEEGLYSEEFVDNWVTGFDKFYKHVQDFPPGRVEEITWISSEKIKTVAREFANTSPACVVLGEPVEGNINSTDTIRLAWILSALTGNLDVKGGNRFWEGPIPQDRLDDLVGRDLISEEMHEKAVGSQFPFIFWPAPGYTAWRAILEEDPYPIRAYLIHAQNPLAGHEDPGRVKKALDKLEFLSVMDQFMTPTAEYADLVLPTVTWLEKDDVFHLFSGVTHGTIMACQKAVEPIGEAKDDRAFFIELGKRAGFDYGFDSVEEMNNWLLEPIGMTFEEFCKEGTVTKEQRDEKYKTGDIRSDGAKGFDTSSGKLELYSSEMEEMGLTPIPTYKEPKDSPVKNPDLYEEYDLICVSGRRIPTFFHSQHRQIPWLREYEKYPRMEIHPNTADKRGIENGGWVWVEGPYDTEKNRARFKARVTPRIHENVVHVQHSWWFPESKDFVKGQGVFESNINNLIEQEPPYDPGCGSTAIKGFLVKVYEADEGKPEMISPNEILKKKTGAR